MRRPLTQVPPRRGPVRGGILSAVRSVPAGRVTTGEIIAAYVNVSPAEVVTILARLSDDERETHPWHRVVAKGGAIGRGPWRETQFARLVREGVAVSPAGIVQDMDRVLLSDLAQTSPALAGGPAPIKPGRPRSHGMKDRPGT